MTFHLNPETEAGLAALAAAHGLSPDDYLDALIRRDLLIEAPHILADEPGGGMVQEENGLRVYRTGKPMPPSIIEDAIRRAREERSLHLTGSFL